MTIEVEPERVDEAREKAVRRLAPRAKVPGFRPGKAPAAMVRRYFGEERILDEALDVLVPLVYREAVQADETIDPIARPQLVVETTEPLVVKATIPVRPTVDIGDYRSVRVKTEEVTLDEERVEQTLQILRKRAATLEPVDRPLSWNDVARINLQATVGGEVLVKQQDAEVQLIEDRDVLFPGFEEALIGHAKGETIEFTLPVPEAIKDEKFAGKQADFSVSIEDVKEEVLPELNDEFTKQVGEGFETADALRERIRSDIAKAEQERLNDRYHDEILGELVDRAAIEFPPVMLDAEVDRLFHDQAGHLERGEQLQQYLNSIGKTEDEVRAELRPVADVRLRRSLVLSEVASAEHIEVEPEEIDAEIDRLVVSAGTQGAQLRQFMSSDDGRATIRRNLATRKTLERLVEIATQDGTAEPTAEVEVPSQESRSGASANAAEQPVAEAGQAEEE